MSSYQYRKSHCGDKTVVRSSYLHNGISYTGKMTSLYWIRAQIPWWHHDMDTLSKLRAVCDGNQSPVDSPHKGPVIWSFVFSDASPNTVEQTGDLTVIQNTMALMWHHCNALTPQQLYQHWARISPMLLLSSAQFQPCCGTLCHVLIGRVSSKMVSCFLYCVPVFFIVCLNRQGIKQKINRWNQICHHLHMWHSYNENITFFLILFFLPLCSIVFILDVQYMSEVCIHFMLCCVLLKYINQIYRKNL